MVFFYEDCYVQYCCVTLELLICCINNVLYSLDSLSHINKHLTCIAYYFQNFFSTKRMNAFYILLTVWIHSQL